MPAKVLPLRQGQPAGLDPDVLAKLRAEHPDWWIRPECGQYVATHRGDQADEQRHRAGILVVVSAPTPAALHAELVYQGVLRWVESATAVRRWCR
ncbi:hypothetical protein [Streptomonospora nanhaiensis]|uniref:Uncharacterized protein n=1 Tax=Streptomonospora nanhaiensis TaxID=1323731 RepID=A0A853BTH6_9ACTN|nr:hypothetical protein [Streptomonospora nanhaiensis]MBV2366195.1 hypothetical protein [Streptomonospora nanhaiensis]NYI98290.1 hypothetical protein [Streptomonospora nanhaiensis]